MNKLAIKKIIISLLFILFSVVQIFPQEAGNDELDSAIKILRKIDENKLTNEDKKNKSIEIDKAWEIIKSSGDAGLKRIKKELDIIEKTKESDDFFKLNASVLLWNMGNVSESAAISKIWNSTSFRANYRYVFYTAFDAASTQNEKVIPMLKGVLKDNSGRIFFPQHSMNFSWPLTVEFIWGAFGHKGLPALFDVLKNSKNDTEIMSAMHILVNAQYLESLPRIRELACSKNAEVRNFAIKGIGIFGHPADSAFIIKGLKSKDADLYSYVWASYEYDDTKISPYLIPLLDNNDYNIKSEVIYALFNVINQESLDALVNDYKNTKDEKILKIYKKFMDPVLDYTKYENMTIDEKKVTVSEILSRKNDYYVLRDEDQKITYNDFIEMSKDWIKDKRITGEKYEWVQNRHVLSVATAKDIDLLLDVKASIYLRLSDECLNETRTIDNVIKILGRRRYRNN
ncbi:MAG TPA: HEAT repeat domain-containing protein [Spirochaetota bacterium]|nr:HEAT repeat domain-containing protein [Spirochaetota bacterium]HQE59971.1 HEAT repeat domain-containing protein [Spirochaetota bacterium]